MASDDPHALRVEVYRVLSQETFDIDAFDTIHSHVTDACAPHDQAIAEIDSKLESEGLSEFKTNLLWTQRRRHEAASAPLRVLRELIEEKAASLFAEAELDATLAETAARYSDRTKVESDKPKLLEGVRKLAGNIVHGLSANAAWQTQRVYAPISDLLSKLQKETDADKALDLAATMVETVKPKLFAKFASHTDIRDELLSAFIGELKK
jgi:hypothetical protein